MGLWDWGAAAAQTLECCVLWLFRRESNSNLAVGRIRDVALRSLRSSALPWMKPD